MSQPYLLSEFTSSETVMEPGVVGISDLFYIALSSSNSFFSNLSNLKSDGLGLCLRLMG